jgi:hypothetical protein
MNLFADHSQIVQLECMRSGIWDAASMWGRVLTHRPDSDADRNVPAEARLGQGKEPSR